MHKILVIRLYFSLNALRCAANKVAPEDGVI